MSEWKFDGKPGLVIAHMQESLMGTTSKGNHHAAMMRKAIEESGMILKIQELLKAFREKKLPIVFADGIQGVGGLERKLPAYGKLFEMIGGDLKEAYPNLHPINDVSKSQPLPEFNRSPDEPVTMNTLLGSFTNSGLNTVLRKMGVQTIVLVGFATHSVIFNATIQACDLLYSVVVPQDAVTSFESELSKMMLEKLFPYYAKVTDTKDVISQLTTEY
jgi:nicotinamidase-related amidase